MTADHRPSLVASPPPLQDDAAGSRLTLWARIHALRHTNAFLFTTMLLSAVCSLVAAFVLSVDAVVLAGDPGAQLACDINATINCGAVATSWQASLFGFPNAFLGLVAEPVVITIAIAALGGVRFPRWFMAAAQGVYTAGLLFAYWLLAQSLTSIGALCPWCLLVTVSTTLVFTTLTHVNVRDDNLFLPRRLQVRAQQWIRADLDVFAVATWLVIVATVVIVTYGPKLVA